MHGPGGLWQGRGCGHPVPSTRHPLGELTYRCIPSRGWGCCGFRGRKGGRGWGCLSRLPGVTRCEEVTSPCPGTGGATDWACRRRHPGHHQGLQPGPARAGRAGHGQSGWSALCCGRPGVRGVQQVSGLYQEGQGAPRGRHGWLSGCAPSTRSASALPAPHFPWLCSQCLRAGVAVEASAWRTNLQPPGLQPSPCPELTGSSASRLSLGVLSWLSK